MRRADYTIGCIFALPCELAAITAMLDEVHANLPQPSGDDNIYTLGGLGGHNIVIIACLPNGVYGTTSAAIVAKQLRSSFTSVRFGLLVGIGGGVPGRDHSVRLGDVVVSTPTDTSGGVIQYDFGKTMHEGKFKITGQLNRPPNLLLNAVSKLRAKHSLQGSGIPVNISRAADKYLQGHSVFEYPGTDKDILFSVEYDHPTPDETTCLGCNPHCAVSRPSRNNQDPAIHYGLIASGNGVMKHGRTRDALAYQHSFKCFEMEAAGLMDNFPCLVIRGVCDYADSHKNKTWQDYAAVVAAAYARELIKVIPPEMVTHTHSMDTMMEKECVLSDTPGRCNSTSIRKSSTLNARPWLHKKRYLLSIVERLKLML